MSITQSSLDIQDTESDEEQLIHSKGKKSILKRSKPLFNVDDLTQENFLTENKNKDTKFKNCYEDSVEIDELNVENFNKKQPVNSEIRKLKSFSSFLNDTSNLGEKKNLDNAEILIESPVFNKDKKKSFKSLNLKKYDIDEFLVNEDVSMNEEKPKLKKCIKYPVLAEKVQNIDEIIFENESKDTNIKNDTHKNTILNLSLSTSSLSISDDNEAINENQNKKTPKKCVRFQEVIEIESQDMNTDLKKSSMLGFEKSVGELEIKNVFKNDTKKLSNKYGSEWLKQATESLNLTNHGESNKTNTDSAKKTSPLSITENNSNFYLQENDVKRRKCKYIKNGMAEKLQKILLRQASSLNFIKHQQTKDEKCLYIFFF